jgi:hypothetical protein
MKKGLFVLSMLFVLAIFGMAQEPTAAPSIEPTTMDAILLLVGGGIVTTITQLLKGLFKASGIGAVILAGIVAVLATAAYFLFLNPPFVFPVFALYAVAIFGEATGLFHFYQKRT